MYLVVLAAVGSAWHAAAESGTISVPCASYEVGNAWVRETKSDWCTIRAEEIVLLNDAQGVILGEKTKAACGAVSQAREDQILLQKEGGALYWVGLGAANPLGGQIEMRLPICGEIPESSTSSLESSAGGASLSLVQTIDVKKLGPETVTVPAGTFDTMAFEATIQSRSEDNPAANYDQTITVFTLEEIGIVRMIMKVDSNVPAPSAAPTGAASAGDPQVNRMLQEGIEALMRGESIDPRLADQLAAMGERGSGAVKTVRQRTTLVTELQSYDVQ